MALRNRLSAERSVLRMAVEPISNTVAITQANPLYAPSQTATSVQLQNEWGKALADGTLSDDLLWPIMHELTHHSSLQSPVGMSLAALAVSHTSVVGAVAEDAELLVGPAKDMVFYAAANTLLKPLMEGLSLFAEFDAVSGNVPIATWATQVASMLFCGDKLVKAVLAGKDPCSPLKAKIEALRLLPGTIARKRDLLRRGLQDPDGYLLGYLLIKMIWVDQTARNKTWRNTDMFLMFINDYFFSDFNLALRLVSPAESSLEHNLENLHAYLASRVISLSQNAQKFGLEFLAYHLNQNSTRPSYHGFKDSIHESLQWEWTRRTLRSLHWQTPDFLSGRTFPRVLAAPATVSIDEEGLFNAAFADGSPAFFGPALKVAQPTTGASTQADGSVEAIVLLPQNGRSRPRLLLCVFMDKELVATFDLKSHIFNDEDAASTCDKIGSYLAYESFAVQVDTERSFVPHGSLLGKHLARYSGDAGTRCMTDLWGPFGLIPDIDENERGGVAELLATNGMERALSLGSKSLGKLAHISLFPLEPEPELSMKIDTSEDQKWIDDLNARSRQVLGFSLLAVQDGRLQPSRI
jgi:hypothetical protein